PAPRTTSSALIRSIAIVSSQKMPERRALSLSKLQLGIGELFERGDQVHQEPDRVRPVDYAMVVGQGDRQHLAPFDLAVLEARQLAAPSDAQDGDLRLVDDGCEMPAADPALIGNRE